MQTTNTTPEKYRPEPRLVDQPATLERLYCEEGLSIREIVDEHAELSVERVHHALGEYNLLDRDSCHGSGGDCTGPVGDGERGFDPPRDNG